MRNFIMISCILLTFCACQSMKGLPIDSSAISSSYDIKDSKVGKGKVKLEGATLEGSINHVIIIDNSKRVNANPRISVPADAAGIFTGGDSIVEPRMREVITPSR